MEFLIAWLVVWVLFIALGMFVSSQKGRGSLEGFLLAFFFGPLGVLIAALLPSRLNSVAHRHSAPKGSPEELERADRAVASHREWDRAERAVAKVQAERRRAQLADQMKARREARDEWYLDRGITPGTFAWLALVSARSLEWYRNASDLGQMAVWAVVLSIPAALLAVLWFSLRR
jgi:hypothetical protein